MKQSLTATMPVQQSKCDLAQDSRATDQGYSALQDKDKQILFLVICTMTYMYMYTISSNWPYKHFPICIVCKCTVFSFANVCSCLNIKQRQLNVHCFLQVEDIRALENLETSQVTQIVPSQNAEQHVPQSEVQVGTQSMISSLGAHTVSCFWQDLAPELQILSQSISSSSTSELVLI